MLQSEFFAQRNAQLIRAYLKLRDNGTHVREATEIVAANHTEKTKEKISKSLVWNLIYKKDYPYAAEAWEIIHKEEAEKEKMSKEKPGTATTPIVANA